MTCKNCVSQTTPPPPPLFILMNLIFDWCYSFALILVTTLDKKSKRHFYFDAPQQILHFFVSEFIILRITMIW